MTAIGFLIAACAALVNEADKHFNVPEKVLVGAVCLLVFGLALFVFGVTLFLWRWMP
jgi:peptide subunit release factor RF-3